MYTWRKQARLGKLFSPFTDVAAKNPEAWFPVARSPEELVTVDDRNRMIGFPYPKYLNAIMEVDQSAGVLVTSLAKARELGVPEDRLVYLHGCADASDLWYPIDRQDFHSSPAMRLTGKRALEMADVSLADIGHIDIYSCFPIAVEIGAEELGLEWLCEIGAHGVVAGPDSTLQSQPANAIKKAIAREGITVDQLDVVEINEAFAAVSLASTRELGVDPARVNPNGGAIAMGHPIGVSGARIVLHAALELKRVGGKYAVAALCGAGGQGDALIVRR